MSPCTRRTILQAGFGAAAVGLLGLAGCTGTADTPVPRSLYLELSELPAGVRLQRMVGTVPVEIMQRDGAVTARSLLCTHQGCTVAWTAETERYQCPCHDGAFDARGNPVYGPPRHPLRLLPVKIVGGQVEITA